MRRTKFIVELFLGVCITFSSCNYFPTNDRLIESETDSIIITKPRRDEVKSDKTIVEAATKKSVAEKPAPSGNPVSPEQLLAYAKTLVGTPYKYASIDPAVGLDCSGFITHVFNHFSIQVPRSSIDFTNYGITINNAEAKPGDLILFTGTDSLIEVVGHMGIISAVTEQELQFIHSTSGKAYGVTITTFNDHYSKRFVKVIRIPYTTNPGL